jgi:hypothetical protein
MSDLATLLRNYAAGVCRDQLWRNSFDGTEVFAAIDRALPGLENATAAARIKAAVQKQYRNTVPLDVVEADTSSDPEQADLFHGIAAEHSRT